MDSPYLTDFLSLPLFRNSPTAWAIACGTVLVVLVLLLFVRRVIRREHQRMLATPQTEFMELPLEVLSRTTLPFFIVVSAFAGLKALQVSEQTDRVLTSVITIAFFWQAGVWLSAAVSAWLERKRRRSLASDRASVSTIGLIGLIARVGIWALVLLLTLDNVGVNISALIAGLGIGGVAVALAVQNILGDLFASLSIALDRPFIVGDFLVVGEVMGSVEYVGIKSTRLRSLSGEQIVMSNADLLSSRIRNYGRMAERRVVFTLNVTYETSVDLIERVPGLIRRIIDAQENTRFDRSHFSAYGPHSLDFETVYYVLSADYNRYMDIQQAINLAIFREFADLGVEFAYPTQKLYLSEPESREPEEDVEPQ
jgi:small-conductance mechanosensitive channel